MNRFSQQQQSRLTFALVSGSGWKTKRRCILSEVVTGQNGIGQNGCGQNDTDKMVATSIDSNSTEFDFYSVITSHK